MKCLTYSLPTNRCYILHYAQAQLGCFFDKQCKDSQRMSGLGWSKERPLLRLVSWSNQMQPYVPMLAKGTRVVIVL